MQVENMLYARGFLICNRMYDTERIKSVIPSNWNCVFFEEKSLVDIVFYYDTRNELCFYEEDGVWAVILGTAIDTETACFSLRKIATVLVAEFKKSKEHFYNAIDNLCGRHVILCGDKENAFLLQDATGMRSVFYSEKEFIIASHCELIHEILQSEQNLCYEPYSRLVGTGEDNNRCMPGRTTPWRDIVFLIPNHELNLLTLKMHRFWPRRDRKESDFNEFLDYATHNFHMQQQALENSKKDIVMSMTAGLDSRVTLAALWPMRNKIHFFTYCDAEGQLKNTDTMLDYSYTEALLKDSGLEFNPIFLGGGVSAEVLETINKNTYQRHVTRAVTGYAKMCEELGLERPIHIRSNIQEVFRKRKTYQHQNIPELTPEAFCKYHYPAFSSLTETEKANFIEAFQEFLESGEYGCLHNYGYMDVLYWEERMGLWHGGSVLLESDLAFDTYCMFNCRRLIEMALNCPDWYLKTNHGIFSWIERMKAELLFREPNSKKTLLDFTDYINEPYVDISDARIKSNISTFAVNGVRSMTVGFSGLRIPTDANLCWTLALPETKCKRCLRFTLLTAGEFEKGQFTITCSLNNQKIGSWDAADFLSFPEQMEYICTPSGTNVLCVEMNVNGEESFICEGCVISIKDVLWQCVDNGNAWFNGMLASIRTNYSKENQLRNTQEEVGKLEQQLNCERKAVQEFEQILKQRTTQVSNLENELKCMKSSRSFRIGRIITLIPRKVRDILKRK